MPYSLLLDFFTWLVVLNIIYLINRVGFGFSRNLKWGEMMKKIALGILLISAVVFVIVLYGEVQDIESTAETKEVMK